MGLLQSLGLPSPTPTKPLEDSASSGRQESKRAGPTGIAAALSGGPSMAGPTTPPNGLMSKKAQFSQESELEVGSVSAAPEPVGDAGFYQGNLQGIRAELDAVLRAAPPDKASRDVQDRIRAVVGPMELAATGGDFDQALQYADQLPGLLEAYKRAADAYAKRTKADQEAQATFEARHGQVEWEIASIVDYTAPPDMVAMSLQDQIRQDKGEMDLAVLEANFAAANVLLNKIAASTAQFRDALKQHQQALTEQFIKDAPKRAYEANFAGIKTRLTAISKVDRGPKQPFADQLRRIATSSSGLQKLLAAKSPDYVAASRTVDELRGLIAQYDLSLAARQKVQDDAAEAKAKSTYQADLKAVDDTILFLQDSRASGSAPFDKAAGSIFERLTQERAQYDKNQARWNYRSKQQAIDGLKVLIEEFKSASLGFWERTYNNTRSQIDDKDLKWATDPAWGDGAMKQEGQKVAQLRKEMDAAAASKSYYLATEKASILYRQIWRLKTAIFVVPGAKSADVAVRPQLLGPPMDAPATYTLLRLLRKDGGGAIEQPDGAKLNADGEAVLDKWQRMVDLREDWSRDLAGVRKGEVGIATALANAKKAAEAIAGGAGGPELRKAIGEYVVADGAVRKAVQDLETGYHGCTKAVKAYTGAIAEQSRQSAERNKTLAQDKRNAAAKKIEDRKNVVRSVASIAASVFNPASWITLPITLAAIGATELVAKAMELTENLKQLQTELDIATKGLQDVEDSIGVTKVEEALAGLQQAASQEDANRIEFENKLTALNLVGVRITGAMKKSPALAAGAKALELRDAVEGARRTSQLFANSGRALDDDLQKLAPRYAAFASSFEESATRYRDAMRATADGNVTTLYEASVYLKTLLSNVAATQPYLQGVGDKANSNGLYRILSELKKAISK